FPHARLGERTYERRAFVALADAVGPAVGHLREHLHGRRADCPRARRRFSRATGDRAVFAEEHVVVPDGGNPIWIVRAVGFRIEDGPFRPPSRLLFRCGCADDRSFLSCGWSFFLRDRLSLRRDFALGLTRRIPATCHETPCRSADSEWPRF